MASFRAVSFHPPQLFSVSNSSLFVWSTACPREKAAILLCCLGLEAAGKMMDAPVYRLFIFSVIPFPALRAGFDAR
jgi:hypothetical protein